MQRKRSSYTVVLDASKRPNKIILSCGVIRADGIELYGDGNVAHLNNSLVVGSYNRVYGSGNRVCGSFCVCEGPDNELIEPERTTTPSPLRRSCTRCQSGSDERPLVCAICLVRCLETVFMPCNHVCCCTACSAVLMDSGAPACPLCRCTIAACERVFIAQ
jgi:hypothetical protein